MTFISGDMLTLYSLKQLYALTKTIESLSGNFSKDMMNYVQMLFIYFILNSNNLRGSKNHSSKLSVIFRIRRNLPIMADALIRFREARKKFEQGVEVFRAGQSRHRSLIWSSKIQKLKMFLRNWCFFIINFFTSFHPTFYRLTFSSFSIVSIDSILVLRVTQRRKTK